MTALQEQRESDIEVIPEGWSIASLGDLGRCIRGVSYKPEHLMQEAGEGVTTLLRSNNIKNDRVNFDDVQFVAGCKISEDQLARPFDVAICMSNGSKALVGKSGVVTADHLAGHPRLTVGAFCAIYRSPVLYTAQIFKSQFFQSAIDVQLAGSAINNLKVSDIEGIRFPLPPLEEREKIAAILTAVDDKLDVIASQIEATQTLKQGLMQTLFSRGVGTQDADGRWVPHAEFKDSELGRIPAGWTLTPLEELAVENITYGVVQPGESVEGGIPLVRGGDIKSGRIAANLRTVSTKISNQFKRTILKGGELLVSLVGYPGETVVVPSELAGANIARQAGMIRTGSVSTSEFIHYYLSSPVGKSFLLAGMIGSAQQVINLKTLREVIIPLPSVAERVRICSICSAVTRKLQALEDKQSSFQDLKRGLMQKLLTGEWRVSVNASATGT